MGLFSSIGTAVPFTAAQRRTVTRHRGEQDHPAGQETLLPPDHAVWPGPFGPGAEEPSPTAGDQEHEHGSADHGAEAHGGADHGDPWALHVG